MTSWPWGRGGGLWNYDQLYFTYIEQRKTYDEGEGGRFGEKFRWRHIWTAPKYKCGIKNIIIITISNTYYLKINIASKYVLR